MAAKLDRVDVPRAAFELARERTSPLLDEIGFYHRRSRYIEPGDALGDILACAYLQGINDAMGAIVRNPSIVK